MAMRNLLLAALLGLAAPLPTQAQIILRPDAPLTGSYSSSPAVQGQDHPNCYLLSTEQGSRWQINVNGNFDTLLRVSHQANCSTDKWDDYNDDAGFLNLNSKLVFTSGGGNYVLYVRAIGHAEGRNYTITAKRIPSLANANPLPPGLPPLPPATEGTASTYIGPEPSFAGGQTLKDCDVCPEMVVIAPGSFMMGSPSSEEDRQPTEGPRHLVTIHRAFAIGKYEVTFDEYAACVSDRACRDVPDGEFGKGRRPVLNLPYDFAIRYVAWLSNKSGQKYFIPSEAEWEYAARAGTDTPWNTGTAILTEDANILNQFAKTVVVGAYPPNTWGLHDVHGNVSEWTQDCLDTGYIGTPTDGSAATDGNCATKRVVRGSHWEGTPSLARSASRTFGPSVGAVRGVGLRVTRALE